MVKKIAILSLVTSIVCCLAVWMAAPGNVAFSALATHLLLIANMLGIWLIWRVVFDKKSIALGIAVIILKYPLLVYLVLQMSRQSWFSSFGLIFGFASFVLSVVLVAVFKNKINLR